MAAKPIQTETHTNEKSINGYTSPLRDAQTNKVEATAELIQRVADVNATDEYGDTPLHWAIKTNNKQTVVDLLQSGADVNAIDKNGNTPLIWATRNNNKEIAAELIQRGADVNAGEKNGSTSLHWASMNNSTETAVELIQRGSDVNARDKDGCTPLHWASRYNSKETAAELIQHGADVNAVDEYGSTSLHWASRNNSKATAAELIQSGADFNIVNTYGDTPLHWASWNNSKETAAELIQREAHVNAVNKHGNTPLLLAIENSSKETAAELIQRGADVNAVNKNGDTALLLAIWNNGKEIAAELIQCGADVNAVNKDGDTALLLATENNSKETAAELIERGVDVNAVNMDGDTALLFAIRSKSKKLSAQLIQSGADVNAVNRYGSTPLLLTIEKNGKDIAAQLIQRGANVNAVNKDGDTALLLAIRNKSKNVAVQLIQSGVDVNAVNRYGNTPLLLATENNSKETAAELIERGVNVNAVNKDGDTALLFAIRNKSKKTAAQLIQSGADVNAVITNGSTPLHWASGYNSKETAAELIESGASVNAVDKIGSTSLHWASWYNSKETAAELIRRGADVNAVNTYGITPLHWASGNNSKETAADLIQRGADVNARDKDGSTPLHWAIMKNSKDTAVALIQRGADVNARDKDGSTPLHWATMRNSKETAVKLLNFDADFFIKSKSGLNPIVNAFNHSDMDIFRYICQKIKSNPLVLNYYGEPYFHAAAKFCFRETLDIHDLSGSGGDLVVNTKDHDGNSPLHFWATAHLDCEPRIKEFGERLIEMGAQVNARNDQDQTPLHMATTWTAANVLLKHGAWPNVKLEPHGDTPLLTRAKRIGGSSPNFYDGFPPETKTRGSENIVIHEWQTLSENGMDPCITNRNGESVLKALIDRNNFLLANALVTFQMSASVANSKRSDGDAILHIICAKGKDELQTTIDNLLKSGVEVNCLNATKQTPLHLVCERISNIDGDKENEVRTMLYWTVSRLLAYGAGPTLKDSSGVSCYDIAEGVSELSELLKKSIDVTAIPQLLKWSEPKSKSHRKMIAQVVRNQNSMQMEWFHYHEKPIGSGSFGHVFAGVDARDGREIAVKRIEKHRLTRSQDRREISNLSMIQDCGEIVRYLCHHEDKNFVFLILDLMEGTLTDYLSSEERDASNDVTLCRDVINGLGFLHEKEILHRDIKPGNILYKLYPRICLKLADFGLSSKPVINAKSNTFSVIHTAAGTRCWMAPELLHATGGIKHSKASDVFSCGLVFHFFLADKRHPFSNPSSTTPRGSFAEQNETEQAIWKYEPFLHKDLTPEALDLLKAMMCKNENERPKATDTLRHPFFWSEAKGKEFVLAVGNQPEIMCHYSSAVEHDLENTLGIQPEVTNGWDNLIESIYLEMTSSGRRCYDTYSAVALVRFVRNCYAHASDQKRTPQVQKLVLRDRELFNKFPTMIIDVYRAVMAHGWDKRMEIEEVLKSE